LGRRARLGGGKQVNEAVVVGGGLAGITAALDLAEAGRHVTLLEARPRLGGATFSVERDGLWVDNGQHVFLRCCTAYRGLLERLGATGQTELQERLAIPVLRPGGRISWLRRTGLPAPLHLGGSIARFGPLPPLDRLRLLPAIVALRRLSLDDPELDQITFGEWLERHGQRTSSFEALWDLIALPTLNLDSERASLALAAMVFKVGLLEDAGASDVGYATVPLQQLHGDLAGRALAAAGVDVQLRTRVESLTELDAPVVVLAVPHDEAADLLPEGALPDGVDPRALGVSPIVNLHVVYDRPVMSHPFAAAVDSPVQWVFDRTGSSGVGEGQYLAVSLSGAEGFDETTVDELRETFLPALEELFPAARDAQVVSFFVTREPRATFRGVPGTARHRPGPVTNVPGLFLAGAWTATGWPATMEGAVRSGHAAAEAVLAA
jgi:squalene-associated FAD-dependent desaturase